MFAMNRLTQCERRHLIPASEHPNKKAAQVGGFMSLALNYCYRRVDSGVELHTTSIAIGVQQCNEKRYGQRAPVLFLHGNYSLPNAPFR